MLLLDVSLRKWLVAGSLALLATAGFFIFLLVSPLVVFEGDLLNGSVAITWYSLKNYGEEVYHPGLSSIPLLTVPVFSVIIFSIIISFLTLFKALRSREVSHIVAELLIGCLEAMMIFTGVFFSLRLNVMHAVSVLPTSAGGAGSAGLLVVPGSVRTETFPSILIRQLYPLTLLSILLIVLAAIIGFETARALETLMKREEGSDSKDEA